MEDPGGTLGGQVPAQHLDVEAQRSEDLGRGRLVILPAEDGQGDPVNVLRTEGADADLARDGVPEALQLLLGEGARPR
eukprot:13334586-Alexandrium_andersonii.AAC.1